MNANLLRAKIAEKGETQGRTAIAVGMSPNSLSRKLKGERDFTLGEVIAICEYLNISDPTPIFLPELSQICNEHSVKPN